MVNHRITTLLLAVAAGLQAAPAQSPALNEAEVRLPYAELRRLIDAGSGAAARKPAPPVPAALLSARYRLGFDSGVAVLDADFHADHFTTAWHLLPLIAGPVSLDSVEPAESRLIVHDEALCLALNEPGAQKLGARFLLSTDGAGTFHFTTPPCTSPVLEITDLPTDHGLTIEIAGRSRTLTKPIARHLPAGGAKVTIRLIDHSDAVEALRPPEPSAWAWQHQAVVGRVDGQLHYTILAHGSAADGSGMSAMLVLPPEARDINVEGDDLSRSQHRRRPDGSRSLELTWETRDILDRDLLVTYRMPLRPLDPQWTLATPAGTDPDATRTRFLIAESDLLAYSADQLTGPFDPDTLPKQLSRILAGRPWFLLEGNANAILSIRQLPVAATADAIVTAAEWSQLIEPDGSSLTKGTMQVAHLAPMRLPLRLPEETKLLTCSVTGSPVQPVLLDDGTLEIPLPAPRDEAPTLIECSFTSSLDPLDPVEGVLPLNLPLTPLFVQTLDWRIDLPDSYQSEVHGNLTRQLATKDSRPSTVLLGKNLLRAEQPTARLFYLRHTVLP